MDVIVDGYNLIGSEQGLQGALEHKRGRLIQQLARYQKAKGFTVTVVFDGWKSGAFNEVQEKIDSVKVIYSRQGEKADSVVLRVARQMGSGCVVVSSDREVRSGVEKCGATAIYAGEFSEILSQLDDPGCHVDEYESPALRSRSGNRLPKTERRRLEKLKRLRLA